MKGRWLRSYFHKQEVNKPENTLATRFYTLLLQPRGVSTSSKTRSVLPVSNIVPSHLRAIRAMASLP